VLWAIAAVGVAAAVIVAFEVAEEPGARPLDAWAYALGGLIGAVLPAGRRWPLGVLFATVALLLTYYSLEYPGVTPALPLAAALFIAARAGRLRWAVLVAAAFGIATVPIRWVHFREAPLSLAADQVREAALLATVVLLGETLRSRRLRVAAAEERLRRVELDRELEATRRVAEERLRIARDVHDVLGHTIAAISVQAALAGDVLDTQPQRAREALRAIRAAARDATGELRATVGLLRLEADAHHGSRAARAPVPGLAQIDGLLALARDAGLRAEATIEGDAGPLPPIVDLTAYRLVQEAVTNTVRHAGASTVTVRLEYREAGASGPETAVRTS
jgi:signal transduction histidine kinase